MGSNAKTATASRRALLAGSGAVLVAAGAALVAEGLGNALGAAPDASPDAELIRLCAEFEVIEHEVIALPDDDLMLDEKTRPRPDAGDLLFDKQHELAARIYEVRSVTLEGLRARAKAVRTYNGVALTDAYLCKLGLDGVILAALVRDLIGENLP